MAALVLNLTEAALERQRAISGQAPAHLRVSRLHGGGVCQCGRGLHRLGSPTSPPCDLASVHFEARSDMHLAITPTGRVLSSETGSEGSGSSEASRVRPAAVRSETQDTPGVEWSRTRLWHRVRNPAGKKGAAEDVPCPALPCTRRMPASKHSPPKRMSKGRGDPLLCPPCDHLYSARAPASLCYAAVGKRLGRQVFALPLLKWRSSIRVHWPLCSNPSHMPGSTPSRFTPCTYECQTPGGPEVPGYAVCNPSARGTGAPIKTTSKPLMRGAAGECVGVSLIARRLNGCGPVRSLPLVPLPGSL
ncbi:hypothetical protein AAFF_G00053300 [Aldrovandia affinis]|uniref:Uncharacterized protein n=1 Tax=Aldrovandia affinis TaxID=143900 RepID=A0AAD7T566_9TELE|nr:hypothetical protein AAFF_G00053300 [Aldrovandia affinis]